VGFLSRHAKGAAQVSYTADRDEALKLLRTIHDQPATAEAVKFYIEALTLRADSAAYGDLHSPCGDVPTLVKPGFPPQPPRIAGAKPGMFNVGIRRETSGLAEGTRLGYNIIATNIETGKEYLLYSENDHGGDIWVADVALPPEAPWGSYKIQYMTMDSGKKFYGYGFVLGGR